jgi:predicted NUDIX family NTP pyrophosphohydrolase
MGAMSSQRTSQIPGLSVIQHSVVEVMPTGESGSSRLWQTYAVEGDWDPATLRSSIFSMQWHQKSGLMGEFPELDHADWFSIEEAKRKILKGQAVFLSLLVKAVQVRNQ